MKRIVLFGIKSFPSRGGTDRVAENIVRHLKDRYHFTVYCYKDPAAQSNIPGIEVIEFTPLLPGAAGSFLYFFFSAVHLLFRKNVDLVHLHKTDAAFFLPLLSLRFKVVSTSHEAPYRRDKWNSLLKLYFHAVERMFIRWSGMATCISKPLTDYYISKYGKEIVFIPNGINLPNQEKFNYENARTFLPPGAVMEQPFLLFSARRLMGTKGTHTMLEALQKIKYSGQIFIAGELHDGDPYLQSLKVLANGLNVFFLGFVHPLETLLALVSRCEFFIFPSENEGMSIMLLEVASVGKPIIASDIPENTQVFNSTEVLYFRSKDVDDLASRIKYALDSPLSLTELGNACKRRVLTDYLMSGICNQYSDVYRKVIGDGQP